jgi:hypothetical protein
MAQQLDREPEVWSAAASQGRFSVLDMAEDEARPHVPADQVFGDLQIVPLPEGTSMEAAFVLIKLSDGAWCARSVGGDSYNRVEMEMLSQLVAYTTALAQDEGRGWAGDDDPET